MPYKDFERRKQAARKWRINHRADRAEYMRRYRKSRSTGRGRGRPRGSGSGPGVDAPSRTSGTPTTTTPRGRSDRNDSPAPDAPPPERSSVDDPSRSPSGANPPHAVGADSALAGYEAPTYPDFP